jgi:hypothetical protein
MTANFQLLRSSQQAHRELWLTPFAAGTPKSAKEVRKFAGSSQEVRSAQTLSWSSFEVNIANLRTSRLPLRVKREERGTSDNRTRSSQVRNRANPHYRCGML